MAMNVGKTTERKNSRFMLAIHAKSPCREGPLLSWEGAVMVFTESLVLSIIDLKEWVNGQRILDSNIRRTSPSCPYTSIEKDVGLYPERQPFKPEGHFKVQIANSWLDTIRG